MQTPRETIQSWVRRGNDPLSATLHRAATSAVGTYGAYAAYGLFHAPLRRPIAGPDSYIPLPGDGCVAEPDSRKTFAIDVGAPPEDVWPFLVQMGYGRAGWYGWYPFENGGRGSASAILERWQNLAHGDLIPDGPRASQGYGVWRVIELVPASTLVLFSRRVATTGREIPGNDMVEEPTIECSWSFNLHPARAGCRLVVRVCARFLGLDDSLLGRLARRLFDVGDNVMEWTMLDGIKSRAERSR